MNQVKTVTIIPYKVLPARLGGEKGIVLFHEYLGKLISDTCIGTSNNQLSEVRNYTLLPLLSNNRFRYINLFLYFTVRRIILQQQATHLILEHPYYGWLGYLLRRTMDIKLVVHSHNIEFRRSQSIGRKWWPLLKYYERWIHRKADISFFISDDDRADAIDALDVDPIKAFTITYGIEENKLPTDNAIARKTIESLYGIGADEQIMLFNGALYHSQNYDALSVILEKINPILLLQDKPYKIIICGKGLPGFFNELKEYAGKNIIFAGFVDDVSLYFKAADIFLNPILSGGGIKTKAVEAMAYNCTVISSEIGALGLNREVCGSKLHVIANDKWTDFARNTICQMGQQNDTSDAFFDYYYWGNIAAKAFAALQA